MADNFDSLEEVKDPSDQRRLGRLTQKLRTILNSLLRKGQIRRTTVGDPLGTGAAEYTIYVDMGNGAGVQFHSILTTKGDIWGFSTTDARIPVGADYKVLMADSGAALGVGYSFVTEASQSLSDVTTWNATTSRHGYLPKLDGNSAHFLDGTGAWSTPSGGMGVSSPLTTKGDIWGFSTTDDRIPVGTDNYVLMADSGASLGVSYQLVSEASQTLSDVTTWNATTGRHGYLKKLDNNANHFMDGTGNWSTPTGTGASSPLTTKGDIWGYSTMDDRFPIGTSAQILIVDSAATFGFKWVTVGTDATIATSGAVTIANDAVTYAKMQNVSAASKLIGRGAGAGSGDPQEISLGTNLSMSGTTLNSTGGATSPLTTKGDLWGYDTGDNRIPVGTDGKVLTADSGAALGVSWQTASSGNTVYATITVVIAGQAIAGTNFCNKLIVPENCTFVRWSLYATTAPTGADLKMDVNLNGTSLWNSNQANRPILTAGSNGPATGTSFDTTTASQDDVISFDMDQVGSTVPGNRITLQVTVSYP